MAKEKTKIYNCEVRLGGDIMHTFSRKEVTNAEIRVLRAIHGEDGVVHIADAGERDIDPQENAYELAIRYSKTSNPRHGVQLVARVLNLNMDGFSKWLAERDEIAELERKEKRDQANREAAAITAARETAEAEVRASLARRDMKRATERAATA